MSSLRELQRAFMAELRAPEPAERCTDRIVADGLPAKARHQIYRNNFRIALTEALETCFPAVLALVGEAFFQVMARRYIAANPPTAGYLHGFGDGFPAFLARQPEAAELPYLGDVAELEWCRQLAYHAPDTPALTLEALGQVPESAYESLRVSLHPAARLRHSPYPAVRIWSMNQPGATPQTIRLDAGGENALIWRSPRGIEVASLEGAMAAFVEAFADGWLFAEACEAATAVDARFDIGTAVAQLCRDGVLGTLTWDTANPQ